MRSLPSLCDATVSAIDPGGYRVFVTLDVWGGQIPFVPVDVLTPGPRDAQRMHAHPLPTPGTRGVVCFTRGDDRTGRWIGASSPALLDASTLVPGSGYVDYAAEYAGGWRWTGQDGTAARVWADGSSLLLGPVMPVPTRHVLTASGTREAAPYLASQRNPSPPGPFPLTLALANGLVLAVNASGSAALTAPSGQTVTLAVSGGAILALSAGGATITAPSGQTVTFSANGATATFNADGSITLTPAAGKKVTATAGGTPAAVQTTAGASPVLWADG